MSELEFVEAAEPEAVFRLLADDTRVDILQALWDADDEPLTFSELRQAIGMRDSGQFNYHLNQLRERFVTKGADGYELLEAGRQIIGAIEAGAYTAEGHIDPIELEDPCPTCGGTQTFRYETQTVRIDCDSCPVGFQFGMPPAAFAGYDRSEIPAVAGRYLRRTVHHLKEGFCQFCDGRIDVVVDAITALQSGADDPEEIPVDAPDAMVDHLEELPMVEWRCRHCGANPTAGLALALLEHPAVVTFYHDHVISVRDDLIWDIAGLRPDNQRITSTDPFRASVTYEINGDMVTLTVDAQLTVTDVDR